MNFELNRKKTMLKKIIKELIRMVIIICLATAFGFLWVFCKWRKEYTIPIKYERQIKIYPERWHGVKMASTLEELLSTAKKFQEVMGCTDS